MCVNKSQARARVDDVDEAVVRCERTRLYDDSGGGRDRDSDLRRWAIAEVADGSRLRCKRVRESCSAGKSDSDSYQLPAVS